MSGQPVGRFFGFALQAVGGLIMLLSGLCSGAFLFSGIDLFNGSASLLNNLGLVLMAGGVPFGIGWLFWIAGRGLKS